jgi:hypothetical protein
MNISTYIMQQHGPSKENLKRWNSIMTATDRIDYDGLTNIDDVTKIISIDEYHKVSWKLSFKKIRKDFTN